jgi:hypothetical protein
MRDEIHEEVDLMRAVVLHYANLVHMERSRADRLQRQLDCAQARIEMLEDCAYGRAVI